MDFKFKWEKTPIYAVIVFLALFLLSTLFFIFFVPERPSLGFSYEALNKTTLKIGLGEVYKYQLDYPNQSLNLTYTVDNHPLGYEIIESSGNYSISIILDEYGTNVYSSNNECVFLSNDTVFVLFSPWMLALNENWTWSFDIVAGNEQYQLKAGEVDFIVESTEEKFGRESYKVGIYCPPEKIATMWVDKEKLILLKQETEFVNVTLIGAPFPILQPQEE